MAKAASGVSLAFPSLSTHNSPLYRVIRDTLAAHIADGALKAGVRLPSSRTLAGDLGVSRNTVALAYEILFAEGLIESRVGDGTYVAGATPASLRPRAGGRFPEEAWNRALTEGVGVAPDTARHRLRLALAAYLRTATGLDVSPDRVWPVASPKAALDGLSAARMAGQNSFSAVANLRRAQVVLRDVTEGPLNESERAFDSLIVDLTPALWPRATLAVVCFAPHATGLADMLTRLDTPAPALMHAVARLAEDGHLSAWLRHCHAALAVAEQRKSA